MPPTENRQKGIVHIQLPGMAALNDTVPPLVRALDTTTPPLAGGLLLVDISQSEINASEEEILALADHLEKRRTAIGDKIAFCVKETEQCHLVRLVSAYTALFGVETQPFFSLDEAVAWLKTPRQPRL